MGVVFQGLASTMRCWPRARDAAGASCAVEIFLAGEDALAGSTTMDFTRRSHLVAELNLGDDSK